MTDRLLAQAWRMTELIVVRDDKDREAERVPRVLYPEGGQSFVWQHGRSDVTLRRDGDAWLVVASTASRLSGPRLTLHLVRHGQAEHAAWEVMARVNRFTRDERQVLQAGLDAATWIRSTGYK